MRGRRAEHVQGAGRRKRERAVRGGDAGVHVGPGGGLGHRHHAPQNVASHAHQRRTAVRDGSETLQREIPRQGDRSRGAVEHKGAAAAAARGRAVDHDGRGVGTEGGRAGNDQHAPVDGGDSGVVVADVGEAQHPVAGESETAGPAQLGGDGGGHPHAYADGWRRARQGERAGRERVSRRDEIEPAYGDRLSERHQPGVAGEVGDVIGGVRPSRIEQGACAEPLGGRRVPSARPAKSGSSVRIVAGGGGVAIPVEIGRLHDRGHTGRKDRSGHHEGGPGDPGQSGLGAKNQGATGWKQATTTGFREEKGHPESLPNRGAFKRKTCRENWNPRDPSCRQ